MSIVFGETKNIFVGLIKSGDLIEFNYNGFVRYCVVITPKWKENCDCYIFDDLEDVSEELLKYIKQKIIIFPGELWSTFGNEYMFKSFKLDNMLSTHIIEYVIWDELT